MADQKIKTDLKIYIIQEVMTDKKNIRRSKHREKYIFNLSKSPPWGRDEWHSL